MNLKYFVLSEFDSPDEPGTGRLMNHVFLEQLDKARDKNEILYEINSGYRTRSHNVDVGGEKNSAHTKGYAADIKCENSYHRHLMVKALLEVGFDRIGVSDEFIHVDCDPDLPAFVMWTY